jgi:hypothetical protein
LKSGSEKPEYYVNNKTRIETMRHFGYFIAESAGHLLNGDVKTTGKTKGVPVPPDPAALAAPRFRKTLDRSKGNV